MQHSVGTDLYKFGLLVLEKKKTFLEFIIEKKCSNEMEIIKVNMLRATIADEKLAENQKNNPAALPSLLEPYRRHFSLLLGDLKSYGGSDAFKMESEENGYHIQTMCRTKRTD